MSLTAYAPRLCIERVYHPLLMSYLLSSVGRLVKTAGVHNTKKTAHRCIRGEKKNRHSETCTCMCNAMPMATSKSSTQKKKPKKIDSQKVHVYFSRCCPLAIFEVTCMEHETTHPCVSALQDRSTQQPTTKIKIGCGPNGKFMLQIRVLSQKNKTCCNTSCLFDYKMVISLQGQLGTFGECGQEPFAPFMLQRGVSPRVFFSCVSCLLTYDQHLGRT